MHLLHFFHYFSSAFHRTYIGWELKKRWPHQEQFLLFELFKVFDWIGSSCNPDFFYSGNTHFPACVRTMLWAISIMSAFIEGNSGLSPEKTDNSRSISIQYNINAVGTLLTSWFIKITLILGNIYFQSFIHSFILYTVVIDTLRKKIHLISMTKAVNSSKL